MRAEQRSKLQASKQRSGTLSRRRRDGSNAAAALKVLFAKKRRAREEDEQGKRGVDGARGRPGPTTTRALRARTKARAPGAGRAGTPPAWKYPPKDSPDPRIPLAVTDRVNFWVSEISTFLTLGLYYRPRAQISNHRRAIVTIVNFGEIFVFGL